MTREPKQCPECDAMSLFKTSDRHWWCPDCSTQYLMKKEII